MDSNEKPRLRFAEEEMPDSKAPADTTGNAEHPAPRASPEFTMKPLAARTRPRLSEEKDAQNPGKPLGGLSKQKRLAIARATDEATGKTRLRFDEPFKPSSRLTYEPLPGVGGEVHRQIDRVEEENSGVQAAHGAERLSEDGLRLAARSSRAATGMRGRRSKGWTRPICARCTGRSRCPAILCPAGSRSARSGAATWRARPRRRARHRQKDLRRVQSRPGRLLSSATRNPFSWAARCFSSSPLS